MPASPTTPFDLPFVRAQFPALAGDWTFLDNAGGSQILTGVVDRIVDYLQTSNVQLGASYAVSQLAGERMQEAQRRIAELVNAERPEEVVMGPTSTLLVQLLARAMAHQFAAGDEVVVTRADHESNIGAWVGLQSIGVIPRFWELNPDTRALELEDLGRLMSTRTKLVAFTHASNIFGTINPVAEITRFVHDRGAKVCVDGVAYAPHRAVDVRAWDVDYYVLSLYKVYGPHHAVLYGKYAHLLDLANLYHYFVANDRIPYKLQPGNPNYELSYGAIGIADYLAELGARSGAAEGAPRRVRIEAAFAAVADHEETLAGRLLSYLETKPRVRIIGATTKDKAVRVPTISFVVDGVDSETIVRHIDGWQIGIRFGDFHSRRLIEHLDLSSRGVVRVSMVHYNTVGEIDRLIRGLDDLL